MRPHSMNQERFHLNYERVQLNYGRVPLNYDVKNKKKEAIMLAFIKIFSLILLSVLTGQAISQSDTAYLSILHKEIRSIQPGGIIYYADKPRDAASFSFISSVGNAFDYIQKRGLQFYNDEKKHIIRE